MNHAQMLDNIIAAKNLLDSVYYNVSNNNLSEPLERSLSMADTCILEAMDTLDSLIDQQGE